MSETKLSRSSAIPLYQQIKQQLQQEIDAGELTAHMQLPSEREMTQQLRVSRITVHQAFNDLVKQGYLYTTPGKGFFVAERPGPYELNALLSFTSEAEAKGQEPGTQVLDATIVPATPALSRQLLIPVGMEVVSLVRLRTLNGVPVNVTSSWLPHASCPGLLNHNLQSSLFAILREKYNLSLRMAHTEISARLASALEQEWLRLPDPAAVLTVQQTTYDQLKRVVEYSVMVFHPQRYPLNLTHSDNGQIHYGAADIG
jgi:GntR family transcriptional regulator